AGAFSRSFDAEVFKLLTRLERRGEPAWLQPSPRPCFGGVLRIAVFRGDGAPRATARAIGARPVYGQTLPFVEPAPYRTTLFGDFGTEDGVNLVSEFRQFVEGHGFEIRGRRVHGGISDLAAVRCPVRR